MRGVTIFVFLVVCVNSQPTGIISTAVGAGVAGFSGDGGPALMAQLSSPRGLAIYGNDLFIADSSNNRIRKVDLTSTAIRTIAGNGTASFGGDGGPASLAAFNDPRAISIVNGLLFVGDYANNRVRLVNLTSGLVTTIAGNGTAGFSGDGNLATAAQLRDPRGLAVDADANVYIADSSNQRVRKVDASTGIIETVAGIGVAGFGGDGGPATLAMLNNPRGVYVNGDGLYIADSTNSRVRLVNLTTRTIVTIAGNGTNGFAGDGEEATNAELFYPIAMHISRNNLYIADDANNRVRRVDADGVISTVAGNGIAGFAGDGGPAKTCEFNGPIGLGTDSAGSLYVVDVSNNRIRVILASSSGCTLSLGAIVGICIVVLASLLEC